MEGLDPNLLLAQMNKGDDGDDKTLWLFLLLMMMGRRGFGGDDGGEGQGVRSDASLADLNAMQNALTECVRQNANAVTERTLDITRDQASNALRNESGQRGITELVQQCCFALQTGQCDIRQAVSTVGSQLGMGLKDVEKAICDCCCQLGIGQKEIENQIIKCCCETQNQMAMGFAQTQNAICLQTNEITQAVHTDGEMTRALITSNRMDDLQSALAIARDENSNLRQTDRIAEIVREQCGQSWGPWGNGGGGPPFGQGPAATSKK